MDPEEDLDQNQEPEDLEPSENQDRNSPQNPSQNNRSNKTTRKKDKEEKPRVGQSLKDKLNPREKLNKRFNPKQGLRDVKKQLKKAAKEAVKKAAKEAAEKAASAALKNPYVLAGIAVVLFIILLIILIIMIISGNSGNSEIALTIIKTGPDKAANGQELSYGISISYPGTAQDIIVTDRIPDGTTYVSSSPTATFDARTKTVSWSIKSVLGQSAAPTISNPNTNLSLTLKATKDNANIINIAQGTVVGAQISGGGSLLPNTDTCGGIYELALIKNRFLPQNFGDPACELTGFDAKDKIYTELKRQDPVNADWWYKKVIPCESGYRPNTWRDPDSLPHTPNAGGAWGMFQVGSSAIVQPESLYKNYKTRRNVTTADLAQAPGLAPDIWGHGGFFDRGDVDWKKQIEYAVQLLQKRGRSYWACK